MANRGAVMAKAKLNGVDPHDIDQADLGAEPRDPIEDVQDDQRD